MNEDRAIDVVARDNINAPAFLPAGSFAMDCPMRKRLVRRETCGVRFVTFSCFRRLPLLSSPRIADHFAAALARVRREHGMRLFAWVTMPEHVHLMVQPMNGVTLERSLRSIKVALARRVVQRWRAMRASILN